MTWIEIQQEELTEQRKLTRFHYKMQWRHHFWMAIWATEPQRKIAVEMSYDDLKILCDLIDKAREQNNNLAEE